MVGSMDSTTYDATNDQRATYSETGPGVNMWAPGTDIMSATSNTNKFSGPSYYLNASYKQCNISGTSMATPQVAGVAALVLQLNPTYTPAQIKTSLLNTAGSVIYTTGLTNDYSNTRSLLGSSQKVLYSNYSAVSTTTTTSTTSTTSTSTSTTSTSTTTTTTAAPPDCVEYFCRAANGGYIYWTDCVTGRQNSALLNGGKIMHIFSTSYPEKEKGANVSIKMIP
jgi:subtilisin family serine protease